MKENSFSSSEEDENEYIIHHEPLPEEIGFQEDDECEEDQVCESNDSMMEEKEKMENAIPCPCIGIEFNSHEEAYDYYNHYAFDVGFSVRKNTRNRSRIPEKPSFTTQKKGNNTTRSKATRGRARNKATTINNPTQDVTRDVEKQSSETIVSSQHALREDYYAGGNNVYIPQYGFYPNRNQLQQGRTGDNVQLPPYGVTSTHASDQFLQEAIEPNVIGHHRPHGKTRFDLNRIFEDPDV